MDPFMVERAASGIERKNELTHKTKADWLPDTTRVAPLGPIQVATVSAFSIPQIAL
jgi:hypothetical protein